MDAIKKNTSYKITLYSVLPSRFLDKHLTYTGQKTITTHFIEELIECFIAFKEKCEENNEEVLNPVIYEKGNKKIGIISQNGDIFYSNKSHYNEILSSSLNILYSITEDKNYEFINQNFSKIDAELIDLYKVDSLMSWVNNLENAATVYPDIHLLELCNKINPNKMLGEIKNMVAKIKDKSIDFSLNLNNNHELDFNH